MDRFVVIGEAAQALGVSMTTLRRWEAAGKLLPEHTAGGYRRYDLRKLRPNWFGAAASATRSTGAYARVSSPLVGHRCTLATVWRTVMFSKARLNTQGTAVR
jgi:hypothetical protein